LLPFHGKGLEEFLVFDNNAIERFVKSFLDSKEKEYKKIVVIGESYGALVLANILKTPGLYKNAHFIFSSPGFFLLCNSPLQKIKIYIASKFMDYCPSCYGPYTTDDYSKVHARFAQKHGVVCFKSFRQLLEMDSITRDELIKIQNPFTIIASRDDDVVDISKIEEACSKNPNCRPFFVADGGHFVHWGKYSEDYKRYLIELLSN
jgi:pimeloyl-ACP methyl ester carboxylesterase